MKDAKMKLLLSEVSKRTAIDVAVRRDAKGRRGREARISAAMQGHGAEFTQEDYGVDDEHTMTRKPVFFIPRRLTKIVWDDVKVSHATTRAPLDLPPEVLCPRLCAHLCLCRSLCLSLCFCNLLCSLSLSLSLFRALSLSLSLSRALSLFRTRSLSHSPLSRSLALSLALSRSIARAIARSPAHSLSFLSNRTLPLRPCSC
jgi:hypothetical protein